MYGTICDDNWDINAAKVICRQMGFADALVAVGKAFFGKGRGPVWLDNVVCKGNENRIQDCKHGGWGTHNCGHGEDAGAFCSNIFLAILQVTQLTYFCVARTPENEIQEPTSEQFQLHPPHSFLYRQTDSITKAQTTVCL